MNLTDTKDNTEFKYFYVSKFKWSNPMDQERNGGHPKEKTVYRGWYNKDTKGYRIAPTLNSAFWLEDLKSTKEEMGYTSDITVVDTKNILDFNLTEGDLDNMILWLESDNKDLKQQIFNPVQTGKPQIIAIINQAMQQTPNDTQGFLESVEELKSLNPLAFEIVWSLVDYLLDQMYTLPEGSIDADWLVHSSRGAGINIFQANQSLNKYISEDRRTNEDPNDLYKAISHIITELTRCEINGK